MNKKYLTLFAFVALCVIAAGAIFFIEKQKHKEEVLSQAWKTISVPEYGASIDYPPNLSAVYGWQDGEIHFSVGDTNFDQSNNYVPLDIHVWLLTNTKAEHIPDGVYKNKVDHYSWRHTYMSATVIRGDKAVGFDFRDFDEVTANRMIDSIKFFDAVPVEHPNTCPMCK